MPSSSEILNCPMRQPNDANAETVGDYLAALLHALWDEDDGFSGKRPLGNSDWQIQVYEALWDGGYIIEVIYDEYGRILFPELKVDQLIMQAILDMGRCVW